MNTATEPDVQYVVCDLEEIPNRGAKAFQLLRVGEDGNPKAWSIVIVRWGKQVFGYINVCPHQGVNLDWEKNQFMDPNGPRLMCGKHGALFDIGSGQCVKGPCTGERLEPIQVAILDGEICVSGVELVEDEDPPMDSEEDLT